MIVRFDFIALYPKKCHFLFDDIMGDTMAGSALRELAVDTLRMRRAVAILALGNRLVLLRMTEGALEGLVLGVACPQDAERLIVAGGAILGSHVVGIGHLQRHVRFMAGETILLDLAGLMGLMAMLAIGDEAVSLAVAGAALHIGGMLAGILLQLGYLLGMTGQTWIGNVVRQRDDHRRMGIVVATEAVLQTEVSTGLGIMTLAALGNVVPNRGRMAHMAKNTGDLFLVCAAVRLDIPGRFIVALDTVVRAQLRRSPRLPHHAGGDQQGGHPQKTCKPLHSFPLSSHSSSFLLKPVNAQNFNKSLNNDPTSVRGDYKITDSRHYVDRKAIAIGYLFIYR